MSRSIARKISMMILCMIAVSTLLLGAISFLFFKSNAEESSAERAKSVALAVAALVDPVELVDILSNMEKNEYWYAVKDILDDIKVKTGAKYLQVLSAEVTDSVIYFAEGYSTDDPFDEMDLGDEEDVAYYDDALFEAIQTRQPQISELYDSGEEYGNMVSGFAPIFLGSEVVGVVGVDISVDEVSVQANAFGLRIALIAVGACVLFGIISTVLVSRFFGRPIVELAKISDRLAEGYLDVTIGAHGKDEVGQLADSFERMIENSKNQVALMEQLADGDLNVTPVIRSKQDAMNIAIERTATKLNNMFLDILSSASQVSAAAGQISVKAQDLAISSNKQSSTVEQFNGIVEQVRDQSEENTREALEGKGATQAASELMHQSVALMKEMTEAMEEINKSSQEISQIIKTIDDIAFQTNILALNAAVEAARAGQHGKGFAVVADEVRNLASKSAQAAKETATLIEKSVEKVGGGRRITDSTRESLLQVNDIAAKTALAMEHISAASIQQKKAIGEIDAAVDQIVQSVYSNSATAEESAASAEELAAQANMLKEVVARFQLRQQEEALID